ncbi:hypothetical protein [Streptomyces sp. NPDC057877]|uniref:hypothetical protein n=1 Tax=Streptomyces sp. NPDC057877 TaxID=3346269 RepID=UPI003687A803
MNKWREDAQPEWPEAASPTGSMRADGAKTRALPETSGFDAFGVRRREGLRGTPGAERETAEAAETAVLPAVAAPGGPDTTVLRDPWAEPATVDGDEGATHDPHEVTVQLDAIQIGNGRLSAVAGVPAAADQDAAGPVFVDETGRRSRRFRRIGMLVGLACAVYAMVIVATLLSGNSHAPWLPVPEQKGDQPAGQVDSPLLPTDSARPSGSDSADPGASPDASGEASVSPEVSGVAPGTSDTEGEPGATATTDPDPTATNPTRPGTGVTGPGGGSTATSDPTATDGPTGPEPTDTAPDPDPTETSGEGTGGGDTTGLDTDSVAVAPADGTQAAENEKATPADSSEASITLATSPLSPLSAFSPSSPEYVL